MCFALAFAASEVISILDIVQSISVDALDRPACSAKRQARLLMLQVQHVSRTIRSHFAESTHLLTSTYLFSLYVTLQPIRLAFAFGGIEFEDHRMPGPALMAAKEQLAPPFGQFPFLQLENGEKLAQSLSCLRFAARQAGLMPKDDFAAAVAESLVEQINDCAGACYGVMFSNGSEEEKAKGKVTVNTEKLPAMLKGVVAHLGQNKFLGGAEPNVADIILFAFADSFAPAGFDWVSAAPALASSIEGLRAHPKLQAYLAKREQVEAAEKKA